MVYSQLPQLKDGNESQHHLSGSDCRNFPTQGTEKRERPRKQGREIGMYNMNIYGSRGAIYLSTFHTRTNACCPLHILCLLLSVGVQYIGSSERMSVSACVCLRRRNSICFV